MTNTFERRTPWRESFRKTRAFVAVDLAFVAAIFVADATGHILLSKTPYLLVLGWISMRLRGVGWRDVGFRLTPEWKRLLLAGVAAGIALSALELFVTQPLLVWVTGHYPDLSTFKALKGNVKLLALFVAGSWVLAGLGEELAWRGYFLNRLADLFGRTRAGWGVSLAAVALVFGLAHSYQELTGIAESALAGALLGLLYFASGRNLMVPVVAHGASDTVDGVLIFLGVYPGM